ncbi:hypothetical protein CYY_004919 [Polysphondylium violaceum]|uniref:A20-type domain-containing protein n=1 Tax=Polysphondylium violaceum TaxID=133409 RepID=A0A8J4UYY8_9MYCE|nr:hypothetical protein CYY_004919 [Polysphondylium violaceum]
MNSEGNQNEQQPLLCKMNCGFYGNYKTNGLCSSCFQKELKKNNNSLDSNSNSSITATTQPIEINNNSNNEDSPSKSKKRSYESYFDITSSPSKFTPPKNPSSPSKQLKQEESNSLSSSPSTTSPAATNTTTTSTTTTTTSSSIPIPTITNTKESDSSINGISPSSSPSIKDLSSSPSKEAFKCKYPGCGKSIGSIMASMSNKCRCGEFFCGKHIHNHNCTFDYKSLAKSNIAKANPQILANKIVKL